MAGTQLDLTDHWNQIARGIYNRANTLALYYEVERLHDVVQAGEKKFAELEQELAAAVSAKEKANAQAK